MLRLLTFLCFPFVLMGQKIYSVDYSSQADIKVFVVKYESECDLKVYKVDYSSQAKGNDGLWYL